MVIMGGCLCYSWCIWIVIMVCMINYGWSFKYYIYFFLMFIVDNKDVFVFILCIVFVIIIRLVSIFCNKGEVDIEIIIYDIFFFVRGLNLIFLVFMF